MGAWWLGYLIAGLITLLSAVPLWFMPKTLPVLEGQLSKCSPEQTNFIRDSHVVHHKCQADEATSFVELAKGSHPSSRPFFLTTNAYVGFSSKNSETKRIHCVLQILCQH